MCDNSYLVYLGVFVLFVLLLFLMCLPKEIAPLQVIHGRLLNEWTDELTRVEAESSRSCFDRLCQARVP